MNEKILGWYIPRGDIKYYPTQIIEYILRMMEEQGVSDIRKEINLIESMQGMIDSFNSPTENEFLWSKTKAGEGFWRQVLLLFNFEMCFEMMLRETEEKKQVDKKIRVSYENKLYRTNRDILIAVSNTPKLILKDTEWRAYDGEKYVFIYNGGCIISHLQLNEDVIETMAKGSTFLDSPLLCSDMKNLKD